MPLTKEKREAAKTYVMPMPNLGDTVLWYPQANTQKTPCAAVVTALYNGSVCLTVYHVDRLHPVMMEGIKHIDDPAARENEHYHEGGWDFTDTTKRLNELDKRLNALEAGKK